MMKRTTAIALCFGLGFSAASQSAVAQTASAPAWPTRAVRLILPLGPASGVDISARLLQDKLSARWGQPVVVENRPGGDALIAIGAFVNAADDHVLLYATTGNFLTHPYQHEKLPYVQGRDIEPIAQVSDTLLSVSVPAASGVNSLVDFITRARATPGKLNVAVTPGIAEFALMAFIKKENLDVVRVPYRDAMQAPNDLAEGRLDLMFTAIAAIAPHVKSGKVKLIAVTGERTQLAPGVPSVIESGHSMLNTSSTIGLFGPRMMAPAVREKIAADVIEFASDKTFVERLEGTGQQVRPGGPATFTKTLQAQTNGVAEIARILEMKPKLVP